MRCLINQQSPAASGQTKSENIPHHDFNLYYLRSSIPPEERTTFLFITVDDTERSDFMQKEQLMSIRQVAEFLQLNQTTVYAWAQQGVLPGFKLGRNWRFRPSEIEAWLEEHRQGQTIGPDLKQPAEN